MGRFGHGLRRELSRVELVISLTVILILVGVAIHKMLDVFAAAEEANMTATLNRVRSAVMLAALTRLVRGDAPGIAALVQANPMDLMQRPPRNYIGERQAADPKQIPGGVWYFDRRARQLVYRVDHAGRFHTLLPGPRRARFRVHLRYTDANRNGFFDPGVDAFEGIDVVPRESYRWGSDGGADGHG